MKRDFLKGKGFKCQHCGHKEVFKTDRNIIDCSKCGMISTRCK